MRGCSYSYGVSGDYVSKFVESSLVVKEFLGRYQGRSTYVHYSRVLAWFFRWLQVKKGIMLNPEQVLNERIRRRNKINIQERRWALRLVLDFCRDNPDFEKCADTYKSGLFNVLKQFFAYHDADLATTNVWNGRCLRKYAVQQLSVDRARKSLGLFSQREKTICLVMIQSGMSIGDLLNKFNYQLDHVQTELENGANRIRVDFAERKGNNFNYFTFIGADGCQELRVWLKTRKEWLRETGKKSKAIFITRTGMPLTREKFECIFYQKSCRLGLNKGAFSFRSHLFRRMFKTESSPPERGVNGDYVEFMMGHCKGIQSVGGTYDRSPKIHTSVVEKEFAKLEPYLNIYSGNIGLELSDDDRVILQTWKDPKFQERYGKQQRLLELLSTPGLSEKFQAFLGNLRDTPT